MSRFIAVMGVGRCGSSAVAGMLHKGGIPMGEHLIGPHAQWNARGHFEDRSWHRLNRLVAFQLVDHRRLRKETIGQYPEFMTERWTDAEVFDAYRYAIERSRQSPIWGRKCVMFGHIWPYIGHLFGSDVRIIVVERDTEAVIASRMQHSKLSRRQAVELIDTLAADINRTVDRTPHPVLRLRYEDVVEDALSMVSVLRAFVGVQDFDCMAAASHIEPALNHFQGESNEHKTMAYSSGD